MTAKSSSPTSGLAGTTAGASCAEDAGRVVPVISYTKCEGAGDCAEVCPYDVFELRKLTAEELGALSWVTWIKVKVHGGRQAFVINGDACHACGLCVKACPEHAIRLLNPERKRATQ